MNDSTPLRLVTLGGECFEVQPQGKDRADNRDGVVHYFHLTDLIKGRGVRKVSVFRGGPRDFYASSVAEYDRRIETVLLNRVRRGFDSADLTFDVPEGATYYKEVRLEHSDFQQQPTASDEEIRQFIVHTAYWVSYRYGRRYPVQFDSEADLEYLGVTADDIRRNEWLLEEEGLLEKSKVPGLGRPTSALVKMYESKKITVVGREQVSPKGTQYDAFKAIKQILRSATTEILVVDNYMDDSVLDTLEALPLQPSLKLLTSRVAKDFGVAVKKFSAQYQRSVEVKIAPKAGA